MAARQIDGRIAVAALLAAQDLAMAWGRGLTAWDAPPGTPPEPTDATALVDEIARRKVTQTGFVVPDAAGDLQTTDGLRWTLSVAPTRYLYVRAVFQFNEAVGETIREFGLFVGSTYAGGLPAGQKYFTPAQVVSPGRLLTLTRMPVPHVRDGLQNYSLELVTPL